MGRFDHLGNQGEATNLNFLRSQLTALQQENARLNQELFTRAAPTVSNFSDGLSTLTALAQQGHPGAQDQIRLVILAIDNAREALRSASSKIKLPPGVRAPESPLEQTGGGEVPDDGEPVEAGNVR